MNFTDEIALKVVHEDSEFKPAQSEIVFRNVPTGTLIEGKVLEKAVVVDKGYLLFITDDVPEEEFLTLLLCDEQFKIIDKATIGAAMSSGYFHDVLLLDEEVHFRFIGDTLWRLRLLSQAAFRVPFIGDPRGVSRPLGLHQHFTLHADPKRGG